MLFRSVLVTGGAGFIGANFVRHLLRAEPEVHIVNLDALTYAGSLENLRNLPDPARHVFVQGDICNRELVEDLLRSHDIQAVFHFAAESHVDRSILGPAPFVQTNVVGTFVLLDAAREVWLAEGDSNQETRRFCHISTDEVFGSLGKDDSPFHESFPYAPNSPYAASKAASDHFVRAYGQTYGLPVVITNCSNNYGPYQFPEKLIPLVVLNGLEGAELPVYGDGQQVRDWLFVEDHCEAIWAVACHGRVGETYNIGGETQPTNLQLVLKICEILDDLQPDSPYTPHDSLIRFVADRPGHDRRYAMDCRKIGRELGWRPRESLASGLRKTVEWYVNHPDWVKAVRGSDYSEWIQRNYSPGRKVS